MPLFETMLTGGTHTGRPLGSAEFIHSLEQATQRDLSPATGGRPRSHRVVNRDPQNPQELLAFED